MRWGHVRGTLLCIAFVLSIGGPMVAAMIYVTEGREEFRRQANFWLKRAFASPLQEQTGET